MTSFRGEGEVGWEIRKATESDATSLARVAAMLFEQTYAGSIPAEEIAAHVQQDFGREQQMGELKDPGIESFVLEQESEILGFAQLRMSALDLPTGREAEVELWRIYIDRRLQGKGVGRALLSRLGEQARDMGARGVWLAVWERNAKAIAFYRRCGFKEVGQQDFRVGGEIHRDLVLWAPAELL